MPARYVGGGGRWGQFRDHLLQEVSPAQSPVRRVRIGQDKWRGRQERYWRWKEQHMQRLRGRMVHVMGLNVQ